MYKITIEKIEKVEVTKNVYQKIADTGNETDGGNVYGYVPVEIEEENSLTVLEQTLDELDLSAVIKALNAL